METAIISAVSMAIGAAAAQYFRVAILLLSPILGLAAGFALGKTSWDLFITAALVTLSLQLGYLAALLARPRN